MVIIAATEDGMVMKGTEYAPQVIAAFIMSALEDAVNNGSNDE